MYVFIYIYDIIILGDIMAYSKRDYTTKEEREQEVIKKGNPTHSSKSKLSEYLSQENVKSFNRIVVSKSFDRLREEKKNGGRPKVFASDEECLNEIEDYFKLCDKYDIIPTIASLSLYLGVNRETLYNYANNPKLYTFSNVVKNAIDTCQSYQETAVLDGTIQSVPFIFLSKNYFGLKDQTDVNISASNQDNTINSNTMATIKEQIAMEEEQKQLDYLKENS